MVSLISTNKFYYTDNATHFNVSFFKIMKNVVLLTITEKNDRNFNHAKTCHICEQLVTMCHERLRDHDHFTGETINHFTT